MFENLSPEAETALSNAMRVAGARDDASVRPSDLLVGIINLPKDKLPHSLSELQARADLETIGKIPPGESARTLPSTEEFSPDLGSALEFADFVARQARAPKIGPEHLLLGLLKRCESVRRLLSTVGIKVDDLERALHRALPGEALWRSIDHGFVEARQGLPEACHIEETLYNPAAEMVVAVVASDVPIRRVYVRPRDGEKFQALPAEDEGIAHNSVVSVPDKPLLYVNVMLWKNDPMTGWGGDWLRLDAVELPSLKTSTILDAHEPPVLEGVTKGWVSKVVGTSADGARIYVIFGAESGGHVGYPLCCFDVGSKRLSILARHPRYELFR